MSDEAPDPVPVQDKMPRDEKRKIVEKLIAKLEEKPKEDNPSSGTPQNSPSGSGLSGSSQ